MRTARIFKNGRNQAVRLPRDMELKGVKEVEIRKEGRSLILTPVKKSWRSFGELPREEDFPAERDEIFEDGRVEF